MNVTKTQALITDVKPKKENGEDGLVLVSFVKAKFSVPREVIDALMPGDGFTDQFYKDDDTRLECVCPIIFYEKVEDIRVTMHIGTKPMVFEAAKIASNMKLTPQPGQYIQVECKLQVHPTVIQSGKIDAAVAQEWIDIEISPMTDSILAAVA